MTSNRRGVYIAEMPADEIGAYFLNIQAKWKQETIRNGKKVRIVFEPLT